MIDSQGVTRGAPNRLRPLADFELELAVFSARKADANGFRGRSRLGTGSWSGLCQGRAFLCHFLGFRIERGPDRGRFCEQIAADVEANGPGDFISPVVDVFLDGGSQLNGQRFEVLVIDLRAFFVGEQDLEAIGRNTLQTVRVGQQTGFDGLLHSCRQIADGSMTESSADVRVELPVKLGSKSLENSPGHALSPVKDVVVSVRHFEGSITRGESRIANFELRIYLTSKFAIRNSLGYTATAMADPELTIRECVSVDDFKQCIELEREVWHDDDIGIMPIRLYMISKTCNAPTIGAFDAAGRLVGFVHTSLALLGRHVVYHSHLAAVVEGLRHRDIGYRMKLAQREHALLVGIPLIIWTFDPLLSRNAHLNINKLGAIIRRYEVNYYSKGFSIVFDSNVPSDRIFAEWWLASPHVKSVLEGSLPSVDEVRGSVEIPEEVTAVREASLEEHLKWRLAVREEFQREFAAGNIVRAFVREPEKKRGRYIFGADEEQFQFGAYDATKTGE